MYPNRMYPKFTSMIGYYPIMKVMSYNYNYYFKSYCNTIETTSVRRLQLYKYCLLKFLDLGFDATLTATAD